MTKKITPRMCGNGPQTKLNRQIEHCKVQGSDTSFPNERIQKELKNEQRKRRHVIIQKSLRWLLCVIYKRLRDIYRIPRVSNEQVWVECWEQRVTKSFQSSMVCPIGQPYFTIEIWFFDTQNTSHLIVRCLKNAFLVSFMALTFQKT